MGTEQLPTRIHVGTQAGSGQLIVASLPPGTTAYIRADVVARLVEAGERYRIASSAYGGASASMKHELIAALCDARQALGEKA